MNLLNHSCPSWDMKEVAYNHRSMTVKSCQSQTFACVAYCSSKTPVGSLKFSAQLLKLPQSFVYDRLWKLKMSAHGRFFICLVSGLLLCWWQGQKCFMMTRRNCQSPVLYRITCLCSDAESGGGARYAQCQSVGPPPDVFVIGTLCSRSDTSSLRTLPYS